MDVKILMGEVFMGISKISKIGLGISGFAYVIMIVLVILSKPIADIIMYMFRGGSVLAIVGAFISKRREQSL